MINAVVDNKWYALVAALFGISSALMRIDMLKINRKKKRSNGGDEDERFSLCINHVYNSMCLCYINGCT